jgi:two-component system, NarL family, response regulator DevR
MADMQLRPKYPSTARSVYLLDDHEALRRGLRHMPEPGGFSIIGESGSAREAAREVPALHPDLVILDEDLPDGSGTAVCRAVAQADLSIRWILMTGEFGGAALVESILAGAWGCLSKQDDSSEQLRLTRRVLGAYSAYSRRFLPPPHVPTSPVRGLKRPEDRFLSLSRQEMRAAVGVGRGLSDRQISLEVALVEETVKNLVSVFLKLGMACRTQPAVLVTTALRQSEDGLNGLYSTGQFPDLGAEAGAALLDCTSETGTSPPTGGIRAGDTVRLADALVAARIGLRSFRSWPGRTPGDRDGVIIGFADLRALRCDRGPPARRHRRGSLSACRHRSLAAVLSLSVTLTEVFGSVQFRIISGSGWTGGSSPWRFLGASRGNPSLLQDWR